MFVPTVVVATLVALSFAHPHGHVDKKSLPAQWYHEDDHPVHELFKRDPTTDGQTRPAVGSPEWTTKYGPFSQVRPTKDKVPAAWFTALDAAVKAGKIPNLAPSTQPDGPDSQPVYQGKDGADPSICSMSYACTVPGTILDAPDGVFATSFDDGPQPASDAHIDFMIKNGVSATHFMIGVYIVQNPQLFLKTFNSGHDIAVHTWTHKHTTTLSNEDVLIELAMTMQIIADSTGGRVPRYWRPPFGDADVRVIAIAKEVLHLDTIKWNQDTDDWSVGSPGGKTQDQVIASLTGWINGPKSPGLNILEHELNTNTTGAWMQVFPLIKQQGWKLVPVTQLFNDKSPYKNAGTDIAGKVTAQADIFAPSGNSNTAAGNSTTGGSNSTTTGTGDGKINGTTAKPGSAIHAYSGSIFSKLSLSLIVIFGSVLSI